jgi:hypothetical protein
LSEINNQKILRVWGTHYERGYAEGYLMGNHIKNLLEEYIFIFIFEHNSSAYNQFTSFTNNHYNFEEKYISQFDGIIAGMQDSGVDMEFDGLNRDISILDLKFANSLVDLATFFSKDKDINYNFGCSTLASWDASTIDDPDLQGQLVISRLLDWDVNNYLINSAVLKISNPSEPDEQKCVFFTYPSLIGGLTIFNESHIYAELNMGNINTCTGNSFTPILLEIRSAIEKQDYNQDSVCNSEDVWDAINSHSYSSGYIILVANHNATEEPVFYIEVNNIGIVKRTIEDNTELHGNNIASTNHFRKLYPPISCPRYLNLIASTSIDSTLTIEENFSTLVNSCANTQTMMTIQYIPSLNRIKWSIYGDAPAHLENIYTYDIDDLLNFPTSNESNCNIPTRKSSISVYPNPAKFNRLRNFNTTISYELKKSQDISLSIYNIKGQLIKSWLKRFSKKGKNEIHWDGIDINNHQVKSGIYLIRLKSEETNGFGKMLILN